jgi:hypothetical protein
MLKMLFPLPDSRHAWAKVMLAGMPLLIISLTASSAYI